MKLVLSSLLVLALSLGVSLHAPEAQAKKRFCLLIKKKCVKWEMRAKKGSTQKRRVCVKKKKTCASWKETKKHIKRQTKKIIKKVVKATKKAVRKTIKTTTGF